MAKVKLKKKPVKGRSKKRKTRKKKGVNVPSKDIIKPIADKISGVKKRARKQKTRKPVKEVIVPEKPEPKKARGRHKVEEEKPVSYETSGGMRKKYFVVLEEETNAAFNLSAHKQQMYSPVLMNQIIKIATDSDIKLNRKDVESWLDNKIFDDGVDKKDPEKIVRPYDPNTKTYNRIRRRFVCTIEERVAEKFRKSVKTNLYGCYLINHLMREHLRGNLKLKWADKENKDALIWPFSAPHTPVEYAGDLIPYNLGEPAALPTHAWPPGLLPRTHPQELRERPEEEEKKTKVEKKRKRTFACPYPGCGGKAIKKVRAEDKKDIYYECQKCKKTFTRTSLKRDKVPEEEDND